MILKMPSAKELHFVSVSMSFDSNFTISTLWDIIINLSQWDSTTWLTMQIEKCVIEGDGCMGECGLYKCGQCNASHEICTIHCYNRWCSSYIIAFKLTHVMHLHIFFFGIVSLALDQSDTSLSLQKHRKARDMCIVVKIATQIYTRDWMHRR